MKDRIAPEDILTLSDKEVFVFGSNLAGRHGYGAALRAVERFGAKYGQGFGHFGESFALPTKDKNLNVLPLTEIFEYVEAFIEYAHTVSPENIFLVTKVGCGLAGYKPSDIAPMFKEAKEVVNIHLPIEFWKILQ